MLMDNPCTNHAYLVKHLYKDYELLKCFLRQADGPKVFGLRRFYRSKR